MKSAIRASKASKSTKRRIYEIQHGIGRYSPARLQKRDEHEQQLWQATQNLFRNPNTVTT